MKFRGTMEQRMRLMAEVPSMLTPAADRLSELFFDMGEDARKFILLSVMCVAAIKLSGHRIDWQFVERAVEAEGWNNTQMDYFVDIAKLNGVWRG